MNKIRASLIKKGLPDHVMNIYNAVDRLAFERDPEKQIRVTHLDYNSLAPYHGPISFADGMRFIKFRGIKKIMEKSK